MQQPFWSWCIILSLMLFWSPPPFYNTKHQGDFKNFHDEIMEFDDLLEEIDAVELKAQDPLREADDAVLLPNVSELEANDCVSAPNVSDRRLFFPALEIMDWMNWMRKHDEQRNKL